jgi:hypothetical protein
MLLHDKMIGFDQKAAMTLAPPLRPQAGGRGGSFRAGTPGSLQQPSGGGADKAAAADAEEQMEDGDDAPSQHLDAAAEACGVLQRKQQQYGSKHNRSTPAAAAEAGGAGPGGRTAADAAGGMAPPAAKRARGTVWDQLLPQGTGASAGRDRAPLAAAGVMQPLSPPRADASGGGGGSFGASIAARYKLAFQAQGQGTSAAAAGPAAASTAAAVGEAELQVTPSAHASPPDVQRQQQPQGKDAGQAAEEGSFQLPLQQHPGGDRQADMASLFDLLAGSDDDELDGSAQRQQQQQASKAVRVPLQLPAVLQRRVPPWAAASVPSASVPSTAAGAMAPQQQQLQQKAVMGASARAKAPAAPVPPTHVQQQSSSQVSASSIFGVAVLRSRSANTSLSSSQQGSLGGMSLLQGRNRSSAVSLSHGRPLGPDAAAAAAVGSHFSSPASLAVQGGTSSCFMALPPVHPHDQLVTPPRQIRPLFPEPHASAPAQHPGSSMQPVQQRPDLSSFAFAAAPPAPPEVPAFRPSQNTALFGHLPAQPRASVQAKLLSKGGTSSSSGSWVSPGGHNPGRAFTGRSVQQQQQQQQQPMRAALLQQQGHLGGQENAALPAAAVPWGSFQDHTGCRQHHQQQQRSSASKAAARAAWQGPQGLSSLAAVGGYGFGSGQRGLKTTPPVAHSADGSSSMSAAPAAPGGAAVAGAMAPPPNVTTAAAAAVAAAAPQMAGAQDDEFGDAEVELGAVFAFMS